VPQKTPKTVVIGKNKVKTQMGRRRRRRRRRRLPLGRVVERRERPALAALQIVQARKQY
jgi:hypothetical protein